MKFEENWLRGYRGEVVQRCGRTDDDGRQVITTAHLLDELKIVDQVIMLQTSKKTLWLLDRSFVQS